MYRFKCIINVNSSVFILCPLSFFLFSFKSIYIASMCFDSNDSFSFFFSSRDGYIFNRFWERETEREKE